MTTQAPSWFRRATALEPEIRTIDVAGAAINYLAWGDRDRPGLVFVHGGAANAHWWSYLVPLFADEYRVVALDLSGHGDSDHRVGERYQLATWTDEVVAVAADAGFSGKPVVIGHSMGGFVTMATAALHPDALAGAIILDSPVSRPDPEVAAARSTDAFKTPKVYPDIDLAVSKFRTIPAQKNYLPYVMDYVGRRSLKPVEGGFTWKFDPNLFMPQRSEPALLIPQITCRVAIFGAEHGLVTPDIGQYMYELLGRVAPVIELPSAGHHMMLDQPLILLTGLRTLIADWEHSTPRVRP
ncbi:MAG: alpha/beta hydrolase [Acidimicrobiales bacterium]|nr:alpha/beta hydrolase [Acidimicrobiales bacterium]